MGFCAKILLIGLSLVNGKSLRLMAPAPQGALLGILTLWVRFWVVPENRTGSEHDWAVALAPAWADPQCAKASMCWDGHGLSHLNSLNVKTVQLQAFEL